MVASGTAPASIEVCWEYFHGPADAEDANSQVSLRKLFHGVNRQQVAIEFIRFRDVASQSIRMNGKEFGTMPGGGSRIFDYWGDNGAGVSAFPTVAIVAKRIAVLVLNVCSCERFFSIQKWCGEDSRSSCLSDENFIGRSMIAYNGPPNKLMQRIKGVSRVNPPSDVK